jgi:hypothetical protein
MIRSELPTPHQLEDQTMSATATAANGRPRKQLSDQLDRLDTIIDCLAEALPAAVADACKEGARAAVKDAIVEIVSNPELRARVAPQPAPVAEASAPEPETPSLWVRLKAKLAAARDAVAVAVGRAKDAVVRRCVVAGDAVVALGHMTGEQIRVRRILLVALGVGAVVGLACLVVPQTTAAVVGGIGATCTAVGVQVGSWLRRAARRVGILN